MGSVAGTQGLVEPLQLGLHGVFGDTQAVGDLEVAVTVGEAGEDVSLAGGDRRDGLTVEDERRAPPGLRGGHAAFLSLGTAPARQRMTARPDTPSTAAIADGPMPRAVRMRCASATSSRV